MSDFLDRLLPMWKPEELDMIDPVHMGGTYGLSITAVKEAIERRKRDIAARAAPNATDDEIGGGGK